MNMIHEDKVESIKDTISNYLTNQSNADEIEFNYDNVTANDSYFLGNNWLSFYDADEKVLYDFRIKTSN